MTDKGPRLDPAFIEKQRQKLTRIRAALLEAAQGDEADEANMKSDTDPGPREYEDDAQKLAMLELERQLLRRDLDRLARVDRALKKIEDGTYGRSDLSGQPIPRERLEAIPEAICTLAEEKAQEQQRRAM